MSRPTDPSNDDFEARLRQMLKAEADTVAHSPEALNLIRERTAARRGSAWFGLPWLRPALAVAGAVLIAASVVMSTPQVREQVLEMVPAGADRQSTPPEQEGGGVAAPTLEEEAPAPEPQTSAPEPSPEPSDEPSEPAEDGEGDDRDPTATSTCPSDPPPASSDDEEDGGEEQEEDCTPSEEPTPGDGDEEPDDTGGGEEPGDTDGGDSGGGDSGGDTGGGDGTDQQSSTADSAEE
ncbi:hypothetical protein [Nocardiopsis sp. CC223A]|uniref:hypothetical protein n=1 Tax=Nocardiopsis sp. CC223A TaxID=3044051 RepID=UPI00278C4888|nr:hypothetical protein [Nocardiopsis sp. CC223A]